MMGLRTFPLCDNPRNLRLQIQDTETQISWIIAESKSFMHRKPIQYSLAALFTLLTAISLVLAYIRFVGMWGSVLALGPPVLVAAIVNSVFWPERARTHRPSKECQATDKRISASVRVLSSLVIGLLIWIPVLLALTLM